MKTKNDPEYLEESIEFLRETLAETGTVYTVKISSSKSGFNHKIAFLAAKSGRIINIGYHMARVLNLKYYPSSGACGVYGCGMDVGYFTVDNLSREIGLKLNHKWI